MIGRSSFKLTFTNVLHNSIISYKNGYSTPLPPLLLATILRTTLRSTSLGSPGRTWWRGRARTNPNPHELRQLRTAHMTIRHIRIEHCRYAANMTNYQRCALAGRKKALTLDKLHGGSCNGSLSLLLAPCKRRILFPNRLVGRLNSNTEALRSVLLSSPSSTSSRMDLCISSRCKKVQWKSKFEH
jgi:hypothetical protein